MGQEAGRTLRILEGEEREGDLDAGEQVLAKLVRKSVQAPALLAPADLEPVVAAYGVRAAVDVVAYLSSFHFINRIADLVGIQSDLPIVQPRWRWLRHLGIRLQGFAMGKVVDTRQREAEVDPVRVLEEAEAVLGPLPAGFSALREVPNVAAYLETVCRITRRLDPAMLAQVTDAVAAALPSCEEEATGFHARPSDPIDALAFVGTRYAVRTTDALVDAVREKTGWGDPELTDLFYAISVRNGLERMQRLLAAPLRPPAGYPGGQG